MDVPLHDASSPTDSGSADAGLDGGSELVLDGAAMDSEVLDAGPDELDAGELPVGGFGSIVGTCGTVASELDEPTPSVRRVRLDFGQDAFDNPAERSLLTTGAAQILEEGTAGGSSEVSEAFAFEVLARCETAALVKTETFITYDPPTSKKTDILVEIDDQRVGVSVTRAVSYPRDAPYTLERAMFIEEKFDDILVSSMNVVAADAWVKQILTVMAQGDMHADAIEAVWNDLEADRRADTILYIVVTDGVDEPLYSN